MQGMTILSKKTLVVVTLASLPLVALVLYRVVMYSKSSMTAGDEVNRISQVQGWKIEHVQVRARVWKQVESGQKIEGADWSKLVSAVDNENNDFLLSVLLVLTHNKIDADKKDQCVRWAEKLMSQTNDSSAAVMGYFAYIRAEGPDRESWKQQLVARGYRDGVSQSEAKAERINKKLGM